MFYIANTNVIFIKDIIQLVIFYRKAVNCDYSHVSNHLTEDLQLIIS